MRSAAASDGHGKAINLATVGFVASLGLEDLRGAVAGCANKALGYRVLHALQQQQQQQQQQNQHSR